MLPSPLRAQQALREDGRAGSFASSNIDLLRRVPIPEIDAHFTQDDTTTVRLTDIWG